MSSSFPVVRKFISVVLILTLLISPEFSYAQSVFVSTLPEPGKMVGVSPAFTPVLVKGLVIHPDQPLNFDFIVDSGNAPLEQSAVKEQSEKIVRYFLAALTVPEESLWVNLSPYEKDRIIDDALGQTILGRDMLAQDYVLKQLTASLIYPEDGLGKAFWARIYKEAQEKFGTTDIPVDTFNKVWITPEKAEVFEKGNAVYVTQAKLKVMLDSDYTAMRHSERSEESQGLLVGVKDITDQITQRSFVAKDAPQDDGRVKAIIRDVILPAIEKEVNEGKNFATLRQVYHAAILAKWYRELVQDTLMAQGYVGTNKISGVTTDEKALKEQIYQRYIAAYKQGVFNYIKEESNVATGESMPKKYFSGGLDKFGDITLERTQGTGKITKTGALLLMTFFMNTLQTARAQVNEAVYALSGYAEDLAIPTETVMTSDSLEAFKIALPVVVYGLAATLGLWSRFSVKGNILLAERYGSVPAMVRLIERAHASKKAMDFVLDELGSKYYRSKWLFTDEVKQALISSKKSPELGREILLKVIDWYKVNFGPLAFLYQLGADPDDVAGVLMEHVLKDTEHKPLFGVLENKIDQARVTLIDLKTKDVDVDGFIVANITHDWLMHETVIRALIEKKNGICPAIIERLQAVPVTKMSNSMFALFYDAFGSYQEGKLEEYEGLFKQAASKAEKKYGDMLPSDRIDPFDGGKWKTFLEFLAERQEAAPVVLSDKKDDAMISDWVAQNPMLTVIGVVASLSIAVGMARSWWLENTPAGRRISALYVLKYGVGSSKEIMAAIKYLAQVRDKRAVVLIERLFVEWAEREEMPDGDLLRREAAVALKALGYETEDAGLKAAVEKAFQEDTVRSGGIDIKDIDVGRRGSARVQFDDAVLQEVFSAGFDGFVPVFVQMMPLESPLVIFGGAGRAVVK